MAFALVGCVFVAVNFGMADLPKHLKHAEQGFMNALEYTSGHRGNINADKGKWQLAVLQKFGLTKSSRLLEIGCGALDLASVAIPFLQADRYVCVERNWELSKYALYYREGLLEEVLRKRAIFLERRDFDGRDASPAGSRPFDFIFSHSVLSHAASWQLPSYIWHTMRLLAPNGISIASLYLHKRVWDFDTFKNRRVVFVEDYDAGNSNDKCWVYPGISYFAYRTVKKVASWTNTSASWERETREFVMERAPSDPHDWVVFRHRFGTQTLDQSPDAVYELPNKLPGFADCDSHCIEITTGHGEGDDGTLIVSVHHGYGLLVAANTTHFMGSVVLNRCYGSDAIRFLQVTNPTTDAWTGSIRLSTDGGATYSPMVCVNCNGGSSTASMVVDGGSDGSSLTTRTQCLSGQHCLLVQALPSAPGCWVFLPNGCPNQPEWAAKQDFTKWLSDTVEGSNANAARCAQRDLDYEWWCGISTAEVVYVDAEACADISGAYTTNSGLNVVLTQNGCLGISSGAGSWTYTVAGNTATTDNGITGAISGASRSHSIVWSNSITYMPQAEQRNGR